MYISKFRIQNFKSFKDATFYFNSDLNMFTGVNNAGKTTVLEAIALWNECFNKTVKISKKGSKNIKKGKYYFPSNNRYFSFEGIKSVRNPYYDSIFYNFNDESKIVLEATFIDKDKNITIPFEIKRASGNVYHIFQFGYENFDNEKFNDFFHFRENMENITPVNLIYASPVARLKIKENFETDPKIKNSINTQESISVLRNRLYNLSVLKPDKLKELRSTLSYILLGKYLHEEIQFLFNSDKQNDIEINVEIKIHNNKADLSLMGSGTLQIVEILLLVYEEVDYEDIGLILLDEPDSHIHRDIQNRLTEVLLKYVKGNDKKQIFISTHNESLIRSTHPKYLFHLQGNEVDEYHPVIKEDIFGTKKGFQSSPNIKILESIGSQSGLDILNAIEADKIILVEGKSDAKAIQEILNSRTPDIELNVVYWSFDGIDELFNTINNIKSFFKKIKNKVTLWEKSVLIFDKDKHSEEERIKIELAFIQKVKIKTHIWKSYTLEATLFSDMKIIANLLESYLRAKNITLLEIHNELSKNINDIIENKNKYIENIELAVEDETKFIYKDLLGYFKKKKEYLEKINTSNIIADEAVVLPRYISEYKKNLNINDIHLLLNKDEVFSIVEKTILHFDKEVNLDKNTYFLELVNLAGYDNWFPEWIRFIDNLIIDNETN